VGDSADLHVADPRRDVQEQGLVRSRCRKRVRDGLGGIELGAASGERQYLILSLLVEGAGVGRRVCGDWLGVFRSFSASARKTRRSAKFSGHTRFSCYFIICFYPMQAGLVRWSWPNMASILIFAIPCWFIIYALARASGDGKIAMLLPYTRDCFVCGAHNPQGLHLKFHLEGSEVRTDWTPAPHHAGFRLSSHGGIISTVLDETMFWVAACATKRFCLAAELNVRFLKESFRRRKVRCRRGAHCRSRGACLNRRPNCATPTQRLRARHVQTSPDWRRRSETRGDGFSRRSPPPLMRRSCSAGCTTSGSVLSCL